MKTKNKLIIIILSLFLIIGISFGYFINNYFSTKDYLSIGMEMVLILTLL